MTDCTLTLVSRANCHLCDDMLADLQAAGWAREIKVCDVDADDALLARFGSRVPVLLTGDDEVLCEGRLDRNRLVAFMRED